VRRLRVEWAASRLVSSDTPLSRLALEAGFVDQSHFTRAFKGRFGITPARYRTAHR
jgi:AraC-like DNA-binding protein